MPTTDFVVTFGELLMRLDTVGCERLTQAKEFHVRYTGAEANAAVALSQFGVPTRVVSAVPNNELGMACLQFLRQYGLETQFVQRSGSRLGILYVEGGSSVRPSVVVYDRAGSSFSQLTPHSIDWSSVFDGARWFHWSGTAPALATGMASVISTACSMARQRGITVSCDLNFRSKLWSAEHALTVMPALMENVDVLIGNEEHIGLVLGERSEVDSASADLEEQRCSLLAQKLCRRFGFRHVAITLRETHGVSELGWRCLISDGSSTQLSRAYSVVPVDRIGAGDAFAGGLIYGLLAQLPLPSCIEFAAAAGCLKHTIPGDFLVASADEVWRLARGEGIGRVQR